MRKCTWLGMFLDHLSHDRNTCFLWMVINNQEHMLQRKEKGLVSGSHNQKHYRHEHEHSLASFSSVVMPSQQPDEPSITLASLSR